MNPESTSSYRSHVADSKLLVSSPVTMSLKEAQQHEFANAWNQQNSQQPQQSPPKSPSIPIQVRRTLSLQQRHLLEKAAEIVEFQDLQFYNRVVSGIKRTTSEKRYESQELLQQNELCLENIMRTRTGDVFGNCYDFDEAPNENGHGPNDWESDDEDQFVLDL